MKSTTETEGGTGTYTPGYAAAKALMILFGVVLVAVGTWQLRTPLGLLIFGQRIWAEATDVVKIKAGFPDLVLHDDAQIQANLEPMDRSDVFWNEFRFQAADGRSVKVRATVGSELKPLYPLLDEDGLPTTALICYDPRDPERVAFPLAVSTWFAPGMVILIGLLATFIGSFLFYWANRPIVLPHIPPPAASPAAAPPEKAPLE